MASSEKRLPGIDFNFMNQDGPRIAWLNNPPESELAYYRNLKTGTPTITEAALEPTLSR